MEQLMACFRRPVAPIEYSVQTLAGSSGIRLEGPICRIPESKDFLVELDGLDRHWGYLLTLNTNKTS